MGWAGGTGHHIIIVVGCTRCVRSVQTLKKKHFHKEMNGGRWSEEAFVHFDLFVGVCRMFFSFCVYRISSAPAPLT